MNLPPEYVYPSGAASGWSGPLIVTYLVDEEKYVGVGSCSLVNHIGGLQRGEWTLEIQNPADRSPRHSRANVVSWRPLPEPFDQ